MLSSILMLPLLLSSQGSRGTEPRVPPPLKSLGKRHRVRTVYFVPKDRKPAARYREKITTLLTFVADVYREDLVSKELPVDGLDFELDRKLVAVELVRGKEAAAHYNGRPEYDANAQHGKIVREVQSTLGSAHENLYVVFAETYDSGPAEYEFPGGIALGSRYSPNGGFGVFSGWILRDEFCATTLKRQAEMLNDETPIRGRKALGAKQGDSPRFEFIEDGFGAVMHELGHALGLPHDQREDDADIMGNGFRGLRRLYDGKERGERPVRFSDENARLLACTRFLASRPDLEDDQPPKIELVLTKTSTSDPKVRMKGTLSDDRGLGAAIWVLGRTGNVLGGMGVDGRESAIDVEVNVSREDLEGIELSVIASDRGGNVENVRLKLTD